MRASYTFRVTGERQDPPSLVCANPDCDEAMPGWMTDALGSPCPVCRATMVRAPFAHAVQRLAVVEPKP